jgi:putative methionine-R-sulfoxide reductase with GAF domain
MSQGHAGSGPGNHDGPWNPDGDRELQELILNSVNMGGFLRELATLTASTLSGPGNVLHCGITVVRHRKPAVAAASDQRARSLDELQNAFDDGPCLTALRQHETVLVRDVRLDRRWPDYTGDARDQGIGAILAVPLDLPGEDQAVVNLYAEKPDSFSPTDILVARNFVANASKSMKLALRLAHLRDTSDDLDAVMKSRAMIDMALGVIMVQNHCTHDEAIHELTRSSSARKTKLRETASAVVGAVSGQGVAGAREDIRTLLKE